MGRRQPSKKPTSVATSQLRIIAGQWRGRKLPFAAIEGLRPTPDRVRETLFNWLQATIPGARCLDLFSGSGAIGFEALSREAASVEFVELNDQACRQLKDNLNLLQCTQGQVNCANVLNWLQQPATQGFDMVFMDPPFGKGLVTPCCEALEQQGYLKNNALIYIETESELTSLNTPVHWTLLKEKKTGQVCYRLYQRETTA